MSPFKIKFFLS